jgi:hypothetical protein
MRVYKINTFHIIVLLLFLVIGLANAVSLKADPDQPPMTDASPKTPAKAAGKCAQCHSGKRMDKIRPVNHDRLWMETHGRDAQWSSESAHGKECRLCHTNAKCASCHRTRPPRSHTGLWNVRTHGTAAKWDREPCKTCHETGACISCHRRTPPLNHRGNWISAHGRTRGFNDSCATCHAPGWCINCHRGSK